MKKVKEASERDKAIIDEYYSNGFNGKKAVLAVCPDLGSNSASVVFNTLMKRKANVSYLDEKKARLRTQTDIQPENVLREQIQWAYADITDYIGLTSEQLKELPPEARRCIQDIKVRQHKDKYGNDAGETIEIKLVSKIAAIEQIAKHIGYYSLDNDQKATKINLNKIDAATLNILLQATTEES